MKRLLVLAGLCVSAAPLWAAEPRDTVAVVNGGNAFGFDLYGQLRSKPGNLFFSPYSVSAALAMTSGGARGRTLESMTKTMHYPAQEDVHPAYHALTAHLNGQPGAKRGYQLSTANRLWGQKDFGFKADFLKLTRDHYGAGLQEVDFAQEDQARGTINAWVEKETRNTIKELLKPGDVDVDTKLVLTNAIYFKGDWASQFKKDRTREAVFHRADGKQVKVPLMHQSGKFRAVHEPTFQVLELPYAGKDLSMIVLLPRKADGLAELEASLSADKVNGLVGRLRETTFEEVALPKFKMSSHFSLRDELGKLGMSVAFSREADFSGMTDARIYIKDVIHEAFVEVNEEGTEASGATAVVLGGDSALPDFRADHPFVFLIRDKKSGVILFLGRISDPTAR
jgi:serpin B